MSKKLVTANERIRDGFIEHQTYMLSYANTLGKETVKELTTSEALLRRLLLDYHDRFQRTDITTGRGKKLLQKFRKELVDIRRLDWLKAKSDIRKSSLTFAEHKVDFTDNLLRSSLPVTIPELPAPRTGTRRSKLAAMFDEDLMVDDTFSKWHASAQAKDIRLLFNNARLGFARGDGSRALLQRVMPLTRKAKNDATAIAFTATAHGGTQGSKYYAQTQPEWLISKERFLATLDRRTTLICMGYDGEIYKVGEGPYPPLHFRCRSLRVPSLTSSTLHSRPFDPTVEADLVKEFTNGEATKRSAIAHGQKTAFDKWARQRKREMIGTVPDTVDYDTFLRGRSDAFQDAALGKARAEIYRANPDMHVNQFTIADRVPTIEELTGRNLLTSPK